MTTLNLPAEERFKHCYTWLVGLTRSDVYKDHGISRVLCGVDKDGKAHDEPCYAADMRELAQGRWIQIPDDERGGFEWVRLVGYQCVASCDYLAAQSLTPLR